MGVDYYMDFGIGYEIEPNKDKIVDLMDVDDEEFDVEELSDGEFHREFEELLDVLLKDTNFKLIYWGDGDEYDYAVIVKKELSEIGLNLEPCKTELDKWLAQQEICKPVGEFGLVGGGYIC